MTHRTSTDPERLISGTAADVVVIGDGPAGSALAAALHELVVDVVLVGPGEPWPATYTTWADDVEGLSILDGAALWKHRFDHITVRTERTRIIDRPYGVVDNAGLQAHLWRDVRRVVGTVRRLEDVHARLVVDATGWPSKLDDHAAQAEPAGWQTAFGVVLREPPEGLLATPTMMDFSQPGISISGRERVPSFAYSLPVANGWLVEETVLSASPMVEPDALRAVLAARLGFTESELADAAVATELVRIPMGAPIPDIGDSNTVRFGASGGMIHPATGYSIGAALRSASGVAESIASALDHAGAQDPIQAGLISQRIWDVSARRTRHLHEYGHGVLRKLDRTAVQEFFDAFFDLDPETWAHYMRIDTSPARLARVMLKMFATAPWRLRAQLVRGDLRRFVRVLRP